MCLGRWVVGGCRVRQHQGHEGYEIRSIGSQESGIRAFAGLAGGRGGGPRSVGCLGWTAAASLTVTGRDVLPPASVAGVISLRIEDSEITEWKPPSLIPKTGNDRPVSFVTFVQVTVQGVDILGQATGQRLRRRFPATGGERLIPHPSPFPKTPLCVASPATLIWQTDRSLRSCPGCSPPFPIVGQMPMVSGGRAMSDWSTVG